LETVLPLIKILVVDDSVTIRAMIEELLGKDEELLVVGVARDAAETFEFIRDTDPDVVTLDIAMPGKDGMAILEELMQKSPRPVIMLSSLAKEGAPIVQQAIERGALSCFNKSNMVRDAKALIKLIKQAAPYKEQMQQDWHDAQIAQGLDPI
jgi:chemotaxis response regulator CheB